MEQLLINLIKDDLVHTRLLNGLMELGFDTTDYYLNLNEAIFAIAGFLPEQITEELREWYFRYVERANFLPFPPRATRELENLAAAIYKELLAELKLKSVAVN